MPQCDFCDSNHPTWRYPAKSFKILMPLPFPGWGSEGDWAACDACHKLIETGDIEGLAARSYKTSPGRKLMEALGFPLREKILELHQRFRECRTGPAVKEE